jgi:hypothetical protein
MNDETWSEITTGLVSSALRKRDQFIEAYIAEYLLRTGLSIQEVQVVERRDDNGYKLYLEKRERAYE